LFQFIPPAASKASVSAVIAGKPVTIGSLRLASGAIAALKLTLSRNGPASLCAKHRLSVTVKITITGRTHDGHKDAARQVALQEFHEALTHRGRPSSP
jgi:hypothetical protein